MLARLHAFIGVKSLPNIGDFLAEQHVLGNNRLRFKSVTEIRLDEGWKTDLTTEELSTIDRMLGGMNRQYGYQ